ncbi:MAG: Validoxylamine A 7'-phosphate phosphatase [Anaerolineales bacterium]|nr:Validoxylamine A 7'-phosphate phosphatase [Anaerolineales bacterium]
MLKALLFDFDGLILDTETPDFVVWKNIYQEHGFEFPHGEWGKIIGGNGLTDFDAASHLSLLSQGRLDSVSLRARHSVESLAMLDAQSVMPGVLDMIHAAKAHGLKLAIASSSHHSWVDTHAKRLGIFHLFDAVIAADDVGVGRTKPQPDLFLTALNQLQVAKESAVVFEDSPNGVKAANRAGIFVVAVPNQATSILPFDGANIIVKSLTELPFQRLNDLF